MNYTICIETKSKRKLKINDQIKKSLYNLIMHHPQVLQSPIFNDFLKVNIDGHTRPQIVPFFFPAGVCQRTS